MENIGDTDLDGFDDIAVGAPFRDNGAVFIFRGTQSGLMLEEYQVSCMLAICFLSHLFAGY